MLVKTASAEWYRIVFYIPKLSKGQIFSNTCIHPNIENPQTVECEAHLDSSIESGSFNSRGPSECSDTITDNERLITVQMGLHGELELKAMAENLPFDLEGNTFLSYWLYTKNIKRTGKARKRLFSSLKYRLFILRSLPHICIPNSNIACLLRRKVTMHLRLRAGKYTESC